MNRGIQFPFGSQSSSCRSNSSGVYHAGSSHRTLQNTSSFFHILFVSRVHLYFLRVTEPYEFEVIVAIARVRVLKQQIFKQDK